jgi:hypothetical protein
MLSVGSGLRLSVGHFQKWRMSSNDKNILRQLVATSKLISPDGIWQTRKRRPEPTLNFCYKFETEVFL